MNVVQIASGDFFSTYGGGQVYVKNIVDEMIAEGMDIAVVLLKGEEAKPVVKDYKGRPLVEIAGADRLEEAVKLLKPDVIHAHSLKDTACAVGRKLGIPVVVTSHHGGILCPAGTRLDCKDGICHRRVNHKDCLPCVLRNTRTGLRWWYPLMRHLPQQTYLKLGRKLKSMPFIPFVTPVGIAAAQIQGKIRQWNEIAEGCARMVAPCSEIAEAMIQNGLDAEKARVIPHGIPMPANRPAYPAITDGKIKFYYVGRICYVKGIHTLLKAFSMVDDPRIELHLIGGAGNKQERRYMAELQKRHRADKRVIWHGKIAPEAIYEATSEYHISSSAFLEAFGLNIAEALALGKPVLATRCGGAEMQIEDGVNGWLVPTNDPAAMAGKIREIIANPERLAEMSENCRAIPVGEHVAALREVYKEVSKR